MSVSAEPLVNTLAIDEASNKTGRREDGGIKVLDGVGLPHDALHGGD